MSLVSETIRLFNNIIELGRSAVEYLRKPSLEIQPLGPDPEVPTFTYDDTGWARKVGVLYVRNSKSRSAKHCLATLQITQSPPDANHLEDVYTLHWADVDYSLRTSGAQPVDILDQRRLDVVFSHRGQKVPGAWIAIPYALSQADPWRNQAYLPPGEYEIEIEVKCENGKSDEKRLRLVSPDTWDEIQMEPLDE